MKTTIKKMDYEKVMALPRPQHKLPVKPHMFWRTLIEGLTFIGMAGTKFRYETEGEGGDLALAEADIQMTSARARVEGGRLGLECEMSITARLCTAATLTALAEATFGAPVEKPTDLLIAYPAHNETLWSLAKRYHAPLSTFSSMSPDTVLAKGEGIVVFE